MYGLLLLNMSVNIITLDSDLLKNYNDLVLTDD